MKPAAWIGIGAAVALVGAGGFLLVRGPQDSETWDLVHETEIDHPVNVAGFLDADFGITAGLGGAIFVTHDGGATWASAENKSMCRFGLDIIDADTAWTVGNGSDVRFTSDGGMTWSAVADVPASGVSPYASFLDDTYGWVANPTNVWATDDGGQTWNDVISIEESVIAGIALVNADTGYVLDGGANVHVTMDGGATWEILPIELPDDLSLSQSAHAALRFDADGNGLIVSSAQSGEALAMRTDDGGATWKVNVLDIEVSDSSAYYLSEDDTLLTVFAGGTLRVFQAG